MDAEREGEWVIWWSVSSTDHNQCLVCWPDSLCYPSCFDQRRFCAEQVLVVNCTMSVTSTSIRTMDKLAAVSVERNHHATSPKAIGDTTQRMIGRSGECCLYGIENISTSTIMHSVPSNLLLFNPWPYKLHKTTKESILTGSRLDIQTRHYQCRKLVEIMFQCMVSGWFPPFGGD